MLHTLLYFAFALLLLVGVHEYGHFLVARLCGIKVLRFSFGFGKVLARCHDRKGTEYTWALIPLGGYVKMLDETESPVPVQERHMAFNNKSVWVRIAVVLAGPVFNFLFAFLALWLMLVIGNKSLIPVINTVVPHSIAAQAGLSEQQEIVSLNNQPMHNWREVIYALAGLSGSNQPVVLTTKPLAKHTPTQSHILELASVDWDDKKPDILAKIGIIPFVPTIPAIIGEVVPDSPASKAGLQVGDTIISVSGKKLRTWSALVEIVSSHPDQEVLVKVVRHGEKHVITVHLEHLNQNKKITGYLGVHSQNPQPFFEPWLRIQRETVVSAIPISFEKTMDLIGSTTVMLGKLLMGQLSWHNISGPVGIAQTAGESAKRGVSEYLFFLALISISLGVLNLLPIPMLDGGHLLYYVLEIILRRPVSQRIKAMAGYVGMLLLSVLMIIALQNDLSRLIS